MSMNSHILSIQAFSYIASKENYLLQFLTQTGVTPQTAKDDLQKPEMMAAVMDFLMESDELLLGFCAEYDISPEQVWRYRKDLPAPPHQAS